MIIQLDVDIKPFDVPTKVFDAEGNFYELSKMSYKTIDKLCKDFRSNVFARSTVKDDKK